MKLTLEETHLLDRAQAQGYVTSDGRDEFDPVIAAYQAWCRIQKRPGLHIVLGEASSKVVFSLLEAEIIWRAKTEKHLRKHIPKYCLYNGEIIIEADYMIAVRDVNEMLPRLCDW